MWTDRSDGFDPSVPSGDYGVVAWASQPARGSRQQAQPRPPMGMAGACRGDACGRRQRSRPGLPPARATAGRSGRQQGQRPHKATPPAHEVPPEGSGACRLHRDSGDGDAVRGLG
ncbi:hypothetical protein GW17_00061776 [Ensete ventricosum]|nr:hypothetical protein GW17_00061776 [Ensete ventricosum]